MRKKAFFTLLVIQMVIILIPLLSFLLNKDKGQKISFCVDEYLVSEKSVVTDGVTVEENNNEILSFLKTPEISLDKGTYIVKVNYNTNQLGNYISASSEALNDLEIRSEKAELSPYYQEAQITIELTRAADDIVIEAVYGGKGFVSIRDMTIKETNALYGKNIFYAFLICLFLNGIYFFSKMTVSSRKVVIALTGIFLASCYPIYTDYLSAGADIPFHLLRIEGIKEGLLTGYFPVKIHPLWAKGYGYATGIFYGDIFLYIPALLRIIGFSIQTSYQFYLAFINLGTVILSYFCFKRIFQSRKIGVLGSFVYSLSVYRLFNLYTRAAVGEYTAMMFLPLILLGFYFILMENNKKDWIKNSIITAIGISGVVQSHLLSCEMVLFMILIVCLISIKKIWHWQVLRSLLLGALLTFLLNLNFIIPFLDSYNKDITINSSEWVSNASSTLQESGLFPLQLFSIFQHSRGGAWRTGSGIANEASYTIGIIFLCGILLFIYLLTCHFTQCRKEYHFKPACVCFFMGCLTIYMSTCLFPWDAIARMGEAMEKLVTPLQFAWRMSGPATLLLCFVICFVFSVIGNIEKQQIAGMIIMFCLILHTINVGWYFYDFSYFTEPYRVYDTYELNTMALYSNEYLPTGTDPQEIVDNRIIKDGIYVFEDYEKRGINIECYLEVGEDGGYIYFPLNYYKNYKCRDKETLEEFQVKPGINQMLRVEFTDKYSGTIEVFYKEPWYWRMGEIISFITLLGVFYLLYRLIRKNKLKTEK